MAFDSQCLSVNRTHTAPGKVKVGNTDLDLGRKRDVLVSPHSGSLYLSQIYKSEIKIYWDSSLLRVLHSSWPISKSNGALA